jgi:hypothetical protein
VTISPTKISTASSRKTPESVEEAGRERPVVVHRAHHPAGDRVLQPCLGRPGGQDHVDTEGQLTLSWLPVVTRRPAGVRCTSLIMMRYRKTDTGSSITMASASRRSGRSGNVPATSLANSGWREAGRKILSSTPDVFAAPSPHRVRCRHGDPGLRKRRDRRRLTTDAARRPPRGLRLNDSRIPAPPTTSHYRERPNPPGAISNSNAEHRY